MRVVLIDDDLEEIEIFGYAIANLSIPITFKVYTNFDTALEELETQIADLPDIIFLDGFMQRKHRVECLELLKQHVILNKINVIIYTGFLSDKTREEVIALGAYDILIKPSILADLKKELERLFKDL